MEGGRERREMDSEIECKIPRRIVSCTISFHNACTLKTPRFIGKSKTYILETLYVRSVSFATSTPWEAFSNEVRSVSFATSTPWEAFSNEKLRTIRDEQC